MLRKSKKEARVIFVINRETGERINLYGWVKEEKNAKTFVIYDATTPEVYTHEYDLDTYEWKYAKKRLFNF